MKGRFITRLYDKMARTSWGTVVFVKRFTSQKLTSNMPRIFYMVASSNSARVCSTSLR